jgi:hypothetical protein
MAPLSSPLFLLINILYLFVKKYFPDIPRQDVLGMEFALLWWPKQGGYLVL